MDDAMKQWTNVELNAENGVDLRKMGGGVVEARSFYSYGDMHNIQLYGPCIDGKIMVKGRMDIPIFNEQKKSQNENENENDKPSILIQHEEEWDLNQNKDNDRLFEGKYIGDNEIKYWMLR